MVRKFFFLRPERQRLLVICLVVLAALTPRLSPLAPAAHAAPAPSEVWYPAGPESNMLRMTIIGGGEPAEFAALNANAIDMMDVGVSAADNAICSSSLNLYLTAPSANGPNGWCYTDYWSRVINSPTQGTPNFFTWLNAHSNGHCQVAGCNLPPLPPSPPLIGTSAGIIRQGLSSTPLDLNPYTAPPNPPQSFFVLNSIYDTLFKFNPATPNTQRLDWMDAGPSSILTCPNGGGGTCGYNPGIPGTTLALRNTLRGDIFWHDGQQLTSFDVAFTYVSLITLLAPQAVAAGLPGIVVGVAVFNQRQFDLLLSGNPPPPTVGSLTVIPGHIWSAAWACPPGPTPTVFPIGAGGCMAVKLGGVGEDPIVSADLIGSGPWTCQVANVTATIFGRGCSSSNTQDPGVGGSYTLTRFGCTLATNSCLAPASSLSGYYFRSSGNLALYIWSGMVGQSSRDFLAISQIAFCFGQPVNAPFPCSHYQEGIGNPGNGNPVNIVQVSEAARFFQEDWVSPFGSDPAGWNSLTMIAPAGTGQIIVSGVPNVGNLLLFEETSAAIVPPQILEPKTPAFGCVLLNNQPPASVNGYPAGGGYDC